ncbi:hypothetical protein BDW74DRAFT_168488 [Aspergillus multicolor]|uniref:DUF4246 domain-containing protein n=1 Tax=Aspergillus multicolor TaxID=41759 RepID=UPI003CCDB704
MARPAFLDNSGSGALRVPGFGDIPIHYELDPDARFAHGFEWRQAPAVTARELAMTAVMNQLTDRPGWDSAIFDTIVSNWREDIFASTQLMSDKAWSWCIDKLYDKAAYYREHGYIRVLNTGSCVCKSDTPAVHGLAAGIRAEQGQKPSVVDPSLYPLVYGKSLVLTEGGRAKVAPPHSDQRVSSAYVQRQVEEKRFLPHGVDVYHSHSDRIEFYCWSSNYQCLPCEVPCEVAFAGQTATDVRITSYINDLHPRHTRLYNSIEKTVSLALQSWNDCLIQEKRGWDDTLNDSQLGPIPLRIITYGVEWENESPSSLFAFDVPSEGEKRRYHQAREAMKASMGDQTEKGRARYRKAKSALEAYLELPEKGSSTPIDVPDDWRRLLRNQHHDRAIIDMVRETKHWPRHWSFEPVTQPHEPYTIHLQDTFRRQGLQVVVQMKSIELTPETPEHPGIEWQLEGQLNERKAAVAVLANDVQNISEPQIAAIEAILGYAPMELFLDRQAIKRHQDTGSIATPQGRLVTFPNVIENRAEPFQLADPTRPDHYRYIKLYLVDPHCRICSTRNVPPQQHDWWAGAVSNDLAAAGFPWELVDQIIQGTEGWPMGEAEARKHREKLLKEHRWNDLARLGAMRFPGFH